MNLRDFYKPLQRLADYFSSRPAYASPYSSHNYNSPSPLERGFTFMAKKPTNKKTRPIRHPSSSSRSTSPGDSLEHSLRRGARSKMPKSMPKSIRELIEKFKESRKK